MSDRYLVGYDGSGPSERALLWALDHADRTGGRVELVTVSPAPASERSDPAERALRAAWHSHPGVPVAATTRSGAVVPTLVGLAEPGDTLVVGTHKTGHLHGRALGTRALAVAAAAPCTVVVVPDADQRFRAAVIAGVGADDRSHALALHAASFAERLGERLVLVLAGDDHDGPARVEAVAAAVRQAHPLLEVSSRTTGSAVAPALLDAALGSALLVVGAPRASDGVAGYGGPVLHDVLINLTSPVLVHRPAPVLALAGAPHTATHGEPPLTGRAGPAPT